MSQKSEPLVPRSEMPQIDEKDIARLIVFMAKAGHPLICAGEKAPEVLTFHQEAAITRPVPPGVASKPILITRLNEIIDGNHRALFHLRNETLVPYLQFDCTFAEALSVLAVFPFAYELDGLTEERN